jgi:hypothetical protein
MSSNSIQPLVMVGNVKRFKENAIVRHLLDHGGIDLNMLACMDFSDDDRQHFMQLIGYSHSAYGGLSCASETVYVAAQRMANGEIEQDARIAYLESELAALREGLRGPIARLYEKHPDDFGPTP